MLYEIVEEILKQNPKTLSIILFGSFARFGKGNDIDILVITEDKKNIDLTNVEKKLGIPIDLKVLTLKEFVDNLFFGSFLSGLFLGYKVLYDRIGIEKIIEKKRKEVHGKIIDKFGEWEI